MNIDMQQYVDMMGMQWQKERSLSQMTLGKLIDKLSTYPPEQKIVNICDPHSYRGYYDDLAFEMNEGYSTVAEVIQMLKNCFLETFEGYKGGQFVMNRNTPIWISQWGSIGEKIISLVNGDILGFELKKDEYA